MALTLRTNGTSGVNLVTASWWNDYLNLLTGSMTDQIVTLKTDVILQSILSGTIAAPTLATAAGTTLGIGAYSYFVTYVDTNNGETYLSNATVGNITTTTGNTNVALTAIPTGPTGTVKRNIYRTKVGGIDLLLADDANGQHHHHLHRHDYRRKHLHNQPSGQPVLWRLAHRQEQLRCGQGTVFSNGAISFDGGNITSDGAGDLSAVTGTFTSTSKSDLRYPEALARSCTKRLQQTGDRNADQRRR